MLDFETFYQKHGENFICDILHIWERDNKVQHPPMTLEDRWAFFIDATNDYQASVCSTPVPTAIN